MSDRLKISSVCKNIFPKFGEYAFIGVLSAVTGAAVALPFILVNKAALPAGLGKGAVTGCAIGMVSRFIFAFVFNILRSNPFWAFLSVVLVIGAGTVSGSYLLGLSSPLEFVLITLAAEAVGTALCISMYRYSARLNDKLKERQQDISGGG